MQPRARHWILALSLAMAAHAGLVFFLGPQSSGPVQVFRGIQVALQPTQGPPTTEEAVERETTEIDAIPPPEVATVEPEPIELVEERDSTLAVVQTRPPSEEVRAREFALPTPATPQAIPPSPGTPGRVRGTPGVAKTYLSTVRAWLEAHKRYPRAARLRHHEGTVLLRFVLDRKGHVVSYQIERTSGFPLLDRAVEKLIQRASPFPAMPSDMEQQQLELIVPVAFSLR